MAALLDPPQPNTEVDAVFNRILEKVASYNPDADLDLLRRAYELARDKHAGQRGERLQVAPNGPPVPPDGRTGQRVLRSQREGGVKSGASQGREHRDRIVHTGETEQPLRHGLNIAEGKVVLPALAELYHLPLCPVEKALAA